MVGPLKPQVFNCPNCGAPLEIQALGSAHSIVCKKCFSTIDVSHPIYKILQKNSTMVEMTPKIPIGTFAMIRGIKWKIIGYMVREDKQYLVQWREYLLYNPYHGYRFLFEIDDHYTLIKRFNHTPMGLATEGTTNFDLPGYGHFKIYNRGTATVQFVVGEFFWRVKFGEKTDIDDYICPPYIFSVEKNKNEINYSIGEYIPYSEIKTAFAHVKEAELPIPWKVAQNQPNPHSLNLKIDLKIWSYAALALIVVAMMSSIMKPKKELLTVSLTASDFNSPSQEYISPSFDIRGQMGNVDVNIFSPVRNQWLEADISLVNESTGQEYSTNNGVEYYYGRDYDGSWSEGSTNNDSLISQVPPGRYHLEVSAQSDMPSKELSISVWRNGNMVWNFFICFIFISVYPLWLLFRRRSFEVSRWENSSYSPYYVESYDDEDDEYSLTTSTGSWK